MLINAFVWPHIAFQVSVRTTHALRSERRNLLFDSFCGGFWVGAMHFNPPPSVTTLSMMTMNNVAIGGASFMLAGWVAQAMGTGVSLLIFTPVFIGMTSQVQLYACLPVLMVYPMALGWICYRQAVTLAGHKRELLALSRTDSLSGLLNHATQVMDALRDHFSALAYTQDSTLRASLASIWRLISSGMPIPPVGSTTPTGRYTKPRAAGATGSARRRVLG